MAEAKEFTRAVNYRKLSEKYISLLLLLFLTPLVFLILGVVVSISRNHRSESIRLYNERTELWFNKLNHFMNTSFYINDLLFNTTEFSSGDYFPVSDACNRTEDPQQGCVYTSTLYFQSILTNDEDPIISANNSIYVSIKGSNNTVITEETLQGIQILLLNKQQLRCATYQECQTICLQREGVWNGEQWICNVTKYLDSICYRLGLDQHDYVLDRSNLVQSNQVGCFYSNGWSPYHYSILPVSSVSISLRLNYDPVVSASLFTQGCSDLYLVNTTTAACFGSAREDQKIMSHLLLLLGFALFCGEFISVFAVCFFWVGKKRHISPTRVLSPSYEQIFTPLMYAETHPIDLPDELAGLGTKGLQDRLAVNGTLRVPKPNFSDSSPGLVEILEV